MKSASKYHTESKGIILQNTIRNCDVVFNISLKIAEKTNFKIPFRIAKLCSSKHPQKSHNSNFQNIIHNDKVTFFKISLGIAKYSSSKQTHTKENHTPPHHTQKPSTTLPLHRRPHIPPAFQSGPTSHPEGQKLGPLNSALPVVRFECTGRQGYFGDMDFGCSVFHYCTDAGERFSFKCNPGLKFNEVRVVGFVEWMLLLLLLSGYYDFFY